MGEGEGAPAAGATLGLEVVPPLAGGHLALGLDWWPQQPLRLSTLVTWPVNHRYVLGVRLGATFDARAERWGSSVSARVEHFPWKYHHLIRGLPFVFSFTLEGGLLLPEAVHLSGSRPFVGLGIGLWYRPWGPGHM